MNQEMITTQFEDDIKNVLHIAKSYVKDNFHANIQPPHLLLAVLHRDAGLVDLLESMGQDYYYLVEWAETRISLCAKAAKPIEDPELDDASVSTFSEADNYRIKLNRDKIDTQSLLLALCTPGVGFSYEQLKTFPLGYNDLLAYIESAPPPTFSTNNENKKTVISHAGKQNTALSAYCTDKKQLARQNNLATAVSLEAQVLSMIETLGRKHKTNVLILGESGVGKTSLINAFTYKMLDQSIPDFLKDVQIFELNVSSIIGGANYKGEIEDRFKKLIKELLNFDKAILVIEAIDTLAEKHQISNSILQTLKPELEHPNLSVIATSSVAGYTRHLEADVGLCRKFEVLKLEEPDENKAFRVIDSVNSLYNKHHNLHADDNVIWEAIRLSKRYLTERCLPDSAIDLIDRTYALINTVNQMSLPEIRVLKEKLQQLSTLGDTNHERKLLEVEWFKQELYSRISRSLMLRLEEEIDIHEDADISQKIEALELLLDRLEQIASKKRDELEASDVSLVVSQLTGIPSGKLKLSERDRLINANDILKKRVVGQDHAIAAIIEAVYESRSGLQKKGQPMGSFFFLGPTGTGKTELAKALADFLFQDETSLIRFDMSEFKEEHSAALLYGSPPGYVGYEEGGLLVNKIRQRPYSVVLFDEIEKAHPSVFDIFLQILDEGKLHDRLGREGDFSNAMILFTSNIGSDHIFKSFQEDKVPGSEELMDIMTAYFRPEFLGRLTEIIPFAPISETVVELIFKIHLKSLLVSLNEMDISLNICDLAMKQLAQSGFSPKYGARPVIGVIRNQIRRPISKMIIAGKLKKDAKLELIVEKNKFKWIIN